MPLSKLFHKKNSLKEKKSSSNSSHTEPNANKATTSEKCDHKNEEIVNKDCSSTEQLSHMSKSVTDTPCDSKEKACTLAEEQPSSSTETSSTNFIINLSSDCETCEVPKEIYGSTERSISHTEIVIDAHCDAKNEKVDNADLRTYDLVSAIDKTNVPSDSMNSDVKVGSIVENDGLIAKSRSNDELLPTNTTFIDVPCDLQKGKVSNAAATCSVELKKSDEIITDLPCDFTVDEVKMVGPEGTENPSLKTENIQSTLTDCVYNLTKDETHNLNALAQEQSGEPVSNSQETGCATDSSVHPNNNEIISSYSEPITSNENDVESNSEKPAKKFKTRSSSFEESSGSKPTTPCSKSRRRKCDSESAATDDEGFEERILHFREKDLEEFIGKCVNRLLSESMAMAARSADGAVGHNEVTGTLSQEPFSHPENSSKPSQCLLEEAGDQKQISSSLEEEEEENRSAPGTVELKPQEKNAEQEMLDAFEDPLGLPDEEGEGPVARLEEEGVGKEVAQEDRPVRDEDGEWDCGSVSEKEVMEGGEWRDSSLDGYRADLEESTSLHSLAKETDEDIGEGNVSTREKENDEEKEDKSGCHVAVLESTSSHTVTSEIVANPSENATPEELNSTDGASNADDNDKGSEEIAIADSSLEKDSGKASKRDGGMLRVESEDLISLSEDSVSELLNVSDQAPVEEEHESDLGMNLNQQNQAAEERKKANWKVGYLHVKLPPKSRSKGHLKAWKKRCVALHPDEFANDPKEPWLMMSVYSGESGHARKHGASFWKSVSCRKAVVYRSSSSSRRYAFTVADDGKPVIHLAADSEMLAQEWMAAARAVLWPPSPVVQLEKMLNGSQFEVSLIDNEFSYRAGLLGMYGHLTISPKKLILVHPQQGYVIQEWYLNTVDKLELMPQTRIEDVHKVLCMTTCSDSSTGKGEILVFCREAVALLQALASTIHNILTYHSKKEGGKYRKELEEMAEWLDPTDSTNAALAEDYYKVPPRQVRSLLDIPNFIFDKPLSPVASVTCSPGIAMEALKTPLLAEVSKTNPSRASQDSGISAGAAADDFLNCSTTSFVVGGGNSKSSDSELSDSYTPPVSPPVKIKHGEEEKTIVET